MNVCEHDEQIRTVVCFNGFCSSFGGHHSKDEAIAQLRANAQQSVREAEWLMGKLDALGPDDYTVTWQSSGVAP